MKPHEREAELWERWSEQHTARADYCKRQAAKVRKKFAKLTTAPELRQERRRADSNLSRVLAVAKDMPGGEFRARDLMRDERLRDLDIAPVRWALATLAVRQNADGSCDIKRCAHGRYTVPT